MRRLEFESVFNQFQKHAILLMGVFLIAVTISIFALNFFCWRKNPVKQKNDGLEEKSESLIVYDALREFHDKIKPSTS